MIEINNYFHWLCYIYISNYVKRHLNKMINPMGLFDNVFKD